MVATPDPQVYDLATWAWWPASWTVAGWSPWWTNGWVLARGKR